MSEFLVQTENSGRRDRRTICLIDFLQKDKRLGTEEMTFQQVANQHE